MNFFGFNLHNFTPFGVNGRAQYLNDLCTWDVFNFITNLALSRYTWKNLPASCNERALEITLFFYGRAVFFVDENLGLIHTPVSCNGDFNLYFESTKRTAHSFTIDKELSITNSVLVRADTVEIPDYISVWNYAPRIANALRSIDVHTETLKKPYLVRCQEKERASVQAALNKISENETAVVGSKFSGANEFEVLNFNVQSALPDMWANVKNYYNQCFNELGIQNNFMEKKAKMITQEVDGQTNAIRHRLENNLYCRQLACKEINEMFSDYIDQPIEVEANELTLFQDEIIRMMAARVQGTNVANGDFDMEESEEEGEE